MFIIIGVAVAFILGYVGNKFADSIDAIGGVSATLSVTGLFAAIIIFALGFFSLINSMYMSSDIELLITMPLSATQIVMIRLLPFIGLAYGVGFVFIIPINIGLSIAGVVTALDWVAIILEFILTPLFVAFITASVVILIMSVVKAFRNVDVLRYIGIGALFILLCVYFYISGSRSESVDVATLITNVAGVGSNVRYAVPVSGLLAYYEMSGSIISLLVSIVITIASVLLFLLVSRFLYLQGALNMQNTAISGKILNDEELSKACEKKDVFKSLLRKEYVSLKRNPTYSLNNFIIGFLWPILALALFGGTFSSIKGTFAPQEGQIIEQSVLDMRYELVFTAMMMFIMILVPMIYQSIAYSSLSREGNSFPVMKQIPASYETQIKAKLNIAERIQHIQTTAYVLVISVIFNIIMGIPFYLALIPTILTFAFVEMSICIDMLEGYKKAHVNWDNEKEVANKDSGLLMGYYIISAFFIPGVCLLSMFLSGNSVFFGLIPILILVAILFIIMIILRKKVLIKGEKRIRTLRF